MPVGKPVPSYKTDRQQFIWGEMHAWISVRQRNDSGVLIVNFSFARSVRNKGCVLSAKRIILNDPVIEMTLIDLEDIVIFWNGTNNSTQLRLEERRFGFNRSNFPYDLIISVDFKCDGVQKSFTFSEPLEFRMVQPRLGGQ